MKRLALIAALFLSACQPPPPCLDDYCRQARLMALQYFLNNQPRPAQTVHVNLCNSSFVVCPN